MNRQPKQLYIAAGLGLLAAAMLPLSAVAQSVSNAAVANASMEATVTNLPEGVKPTGTVSYSDLVRQGQISPKASAKLYREVPRHRRPDGSATSAPLGAAQLIEHTENAKVGVNAAAAFTHVKGFLGIHSYDNVTVGTGEIEPPDQGLAVYNNTIAEINNEVVEFFDATTGASKAPPVSIATFFGDIYSLGDVQVFFDPTIGRMDFHPD